MFGDLKVSPMGKFIPQDGWGNGDWKRQVGVPVGAGGEHLELALCQHVLHFWGKVVPVSAQELVNLQESVLGDLGKWGRGALEHKHVSLAIFFCIHRTRHCGL